MAHLTMEADKMLDVYIHDYLVKRKYSNSARTFQTEAQIPKKPSAIDTPGGFLLEWWSIFWDIFIDRYKRTGPNNEALIIKAQEQLQQQKQQQNSQKHLLQQMQMQLLLQKHIEQQQLQQQGDETQFPHGTASNNIVKQNLGISSVSAQKMHKEDLNPQIQKNILSEAEMKKLMQPKYSEHVGQLSDATHASIARSAVSGHQPSVQLVHNTPIGSLMSLQAAKDQKQLPLAHKDLKNLMNPLSPIATGSDGSLHEVTGSNQAGNAFPLNGWPVMGLDQIQTGLPQQKRSFTHPYQPSQAQLHQQIRMLLSDQNSGMVNNEKDNQRNFVGNVLPAILQVQVGRPVLSHKNAEIPTKSSNQSYQQFMQPIPLGSTSENSDCQIQQLDKMDAAVSNTEDVAISNTSRDCDQASKNLTWKKRKQPMSSAYPPHSSGATNTTAVTASSTPSTPSTHTTGDMITMPNIPSEDNSSKADPDQLAKDGHLEDNVNCFLSPNSPGSTPTGCSDSNQDTIFSEVGTIYANKVKCCEFSSNGKLIAASGDNGKVVLWCTESRKQKYQFDHFGTITDLRFGPRLPRLATSSLDKTVKIWNVDNQGSPIQTFIGHSASVMSVDFHPKKEDLVCSCDDGSAIRYWSVKNGVCTGVLKVGATQVRFQPTRGRYLAAAVGNGVSLVDIETQTFRYPLKDHTTDVLSVCWNSSGEYLACLSEDFIRVWKIGSWGQQNCMHELSITGKKFRCCAFHPCHSSLLVIGFNQSLELWHMAENKMMTALGQPIDTLAVSDPAGLVASVSDDKLIKLWK